MRLKRRLARLKPEYGVHKCLNCNTTYDGDFCPKCGQSAKTRRLTWLGWWQNFLEVWGIGNTPFMRTITGLLYRPGHLIGDFLEGKRIRYFSPSKTLFIIAAAMALLRWALPGQFDEIEDMKIKGNETFMWMNRYLNELEKFNNDHILFSLTLAHAAFLIPLKFSFRKSPLRPHLTIPEHMFVQVFLMTQLLLLSIIWVIITLGNVDKDEIYVAPSYIMLGVLIFDFKQLFGYSWWGTFWRTVVSLVFALLIVFITITFVFVLMAVLHKYGWV